MGSAAAVAGAADSANSPAARAVAAWLPAAELRRGLAAAAEQAAPQRAVQWAARRLAAVARRSAGAVQVQVQVQVVEHRGQVVEHQGQAVPLAPHRGKQPPRRPAHTTS